MSYEERNLILKEDLDIVGLPTAPTIISGIIGITHKTDGGFKDMMSRIATANPSSPLADEYGNKDVKATKTRDAVTAQKVRQLKST